MNIGQVFQKCIDAYNAFKNGDKLAAALMLLEILKAFLNSLPVTDIGKPLPVASGYSPGFNLDTASEDELMEELNKICCNPPVGTTLTAPPAGPVITLLLPIIVKLVLKWLGL